MEEILLAVLKGSELIGELSATVYQKLSSSGETEGDGGERATADESQ